MTGSRIGEFIDVKRLAVTWLTGQLAGIRVVTLVPASLNESLPLVWVATAPGADDYDVATYRLDLYSFAASEGAMWDLAGRVHASMRALGGQVVDGQQVYSTRSPGTPVDAFWSTDVWRAVASYEVDVPTLA